MFQARVMVLMTLVSGAAAAQVPNLVEAGYSWRPVLAVDGAPGQAGASGVAVAVNLPIVLGERLFLTPGVSYQNQLLRYRAMDVDPDALHQLELPLLAVWMPSDRWTLVGRVAPGLAGDFRSLDRHFRLSAMALAIHVFSPRFQLGVGALVDAGPDRVLPLPAVRIDWQVVDGLFVDAFLPSFVKLFYRGDRWEVGAALTVEGGQYATESPFRMGSATIGYYSVDAGAMLGARVAGSTWLTGFGGWSLLRRYEVKDVVETRTFEPAAGVVVRVGAEVRIP